MVRLDAKVPEALNHLVGGVEGAAFGTHALCLSIAFRVAVGVCVVVASEIYGI